MDPHELRAALDRHDAALEDTFAGWGSSVSHVKAFLTKNTPHSAYSAALHTERTDENGRDHPFWYEPHQDYGKRRKFKALVERIQNSLDTLRAINETLLALLEAPRPGHTPSELGALRDAIEALRLPAREFNGTFEDMEDGILFLDIGSSGAWYDETLLSIRELESLAAHVGLTKGLRAAKALLRKLR